MRLTYKISKRKANDGFTLIELIIVIVILCILSGVVIFVINPTERQRRAYETVMRVNVEKICLAANACANSRQDAHVSCGTFEDIGVDVNQLYENTPTQLIQYENHFGAGDAWWDGFLGVYRRDRNGDGVITPPEDVECVYNCNYVDEQGVFVLKQNMHDDGTIISNYNCLID